MDQVRSKVDGPAASGGAEAFLPVQVFLGLYLVLFAFFILLAAMSKPEASRSVQAIASVRTSFSSDVPLGSVGEASRLFVDTEKSLLDRVGRLVEADLPVAPAKRESTSGQIVLEIPPEVLFADQGLSPVGRAMMRRIADLLRAPPEGLTFGVTAVVPAAAAGPLHAGRIARTLVEDGTPQSLVRAGVAEGLSAVRFAFVVRAAGAAP